jgi:MFS family permease
VEHQKPIIFYGYVVVSASFVITIAAWGTNRSFGVFLAPMLTEFGWSRAGISGAFTLVMLVTGAMSIVAGKLTDKIGPRIVLLVCGFFLASSYILVSQVKVIWQFYLYYGAIAGVGLSGCIAPLLSSVAKWFEKRRALMSGILMTGPALGIVFVPLVSSMLISATGWRIAYVILGVAVLVVITASALFLRREPRDMKLQPYGSERDSSGALGQQDKGASLIEAITTPQFWLLSVAAFSDSFLVSVVVVHIVVHALGLGIQATAAASILSVAAGVSIPARIIMGGMADKIGNSSALMICFFMGVVAFVLLLFASHLWTLYLFAVLYGFGLWASLAIISAMTAELFGLRFHGTIYACIFLIHTIGGATGPVVVGHLFDVTNSYQTGFIICAAVSLACFIAVSMLRFFPDGPWVKRSKS